MQPSIVYRKKYCIAIAIATIKRLRFGLFRGVYYPKNEQNLKKNSYCDFPIYNSKLHDICFTSDLVHNTLKCILRALNI